MRGERWLAGLTIALGAIQAWQSRYFLDANGVCYLDLAGQWRAAVSAGWPPLYGWVLGAGLWALRPSPAWELPAVRLVNFGLFVAALAGFRFFLGRYLEAWKAAPEKMMVVLGYTLFSWTSLKMAALRWVSPDLAVAGVVYLAAGLILRIQTRGGGWGVWSGLGLVLGAGCLANARLLPVGLVFVGSAAWAAGRSRWKQARVALVAFVAVVGAGAAVRGGGPRRAPRALLEQPRVVESEAPCPAMRPSADVARAFRVYGHMFAGGWQIGLVIIAALLLWRGAGAASLAGAATLVVPALAGFGMYVLADVEPRQVAPFFALLWLGAVMAARPGPAQVEAAAVVTWLVAGVVLVAVMRGALERTPDRYTRAAAELRAAGLESGSKVAWIGVAHPDIILLRLARAKVVAQVEEDPYWQAPVARRGQVREVLEKLGVRAMVAARGEAPPETGWRKVEGGPFWYRMVP